jgi:hypothetical protein
VLCYAIQNLQDYISVRAGLEKTHPTRRHTGPASTSGLAHPKHADAILRSHPPLLVNRPGDACEREADRISFDALASTAPVSPIGARPATDYENSAPQDLRQLLAKSSGQSLDAKTRRFAEPRFAYDFSRVRIHADPAAASASQRLGAVAFTLGSNIFFNSGQYLPNRPAGLALLAHELTHVVQQASGGVSGQVIQRAVTDYRQLTWGDFNPTLTPTPGGEGAEVRATFATSTYDPESDSKEILEAEKPKGKDKDKSRAKEKPVKCVTGKHHFTKFEATYRPKQADLDNFPKAQMELNEARCQPRFKGNVQDYCNRTFPKAVADCIKGETAERQRLLKHEQGHFDIDNVMAINARADVNQSAKPATETGCGLNEAQDKAGASYDAIRNEMTDKVKAWLQLKNEVETKYDAETKNSTDFAVQAAWEKDIAKRLPGFKPKLATASSPFPTAPAPTANHPATPPSAQKP